MNYTKEDLQKIAARAIYSMPKNLTASQFFEVISMMTHGGAVGLAKLEKSSIEVIR